MSLGVATPGPADAFQKYGEYFYDHISAFGGASDAVKDLRGFGYDLYAGIYRESMRLAEWAFAQDDIARA